MNTEKFTENQKQLPLYMYLKLKKQCLQLSILGYPIIANRQTISKIPEKENKGSYQDMLEYLTKDIGYAIPIKSVKKIEEVTLEQLKENFPSFNVPQSYFLLNNKKEILEYLLSKKIIQILILLKI